MSWTRDEEMNIVTQIRNGVSLDNVSIANKSNDMVKLRLKKIVYENVMSGKTCAQIAGALRINEGVVAQYYNEYKGLRNKVESVDDKIKRLEKENMLMRLMIENKELKSKMA